MEKNRDRKLSMKKRTCEYRGCTSQYLMKDCKKCKHHRGHHLKYARECICAECNELEAQYGGVYRY